jgi:flagellin-specific chaperone FliS
MKTLKQLNDLSYQSKIFLYENADVEFLEVLDGSFIFESDENEQQNEKKLVEQDHPENVEQQPEQQEEQPVPTIPEIVSFEINAADDKSLMFMLYDKILDLTDIFDNLLNTGSINFDKKFIAPLKNLSEYNKVINELIFSINVNTSYSIIGKIQLDLHSILEQIAQEERNKDEQN